VPAKSERAAITDDVAAQVAVAVMKCIAVAASAKDQRQGEQRDDGAEIELSSTTSV
jgi:hypothetical protein